MAFESGGPVDWEALVNEHKNRLYRMALAILGDPHEAEDAVQDAFLAYLEKAPRSLASPGAWLTQVLVNNCRSRLRLSWRKTVPLPDSLSVPGPEEREDLEELFSLPPEDRTVIHLYYYEGWTTEEIARMLRMRPGTVRSRLARARQKLRRLLDDSS